MQYTHATAEHHRQFLTGRLVALEQEHFGYELLIAATPADDPLRASYIAQRDATGRNIEAFRNGLAALDDTGRPTIPTPPAGAESPTPAAANRATRRATTKGRARLPKK